MLTLSMVLHAALFLWYNPDLLPPTLYRASTGPRLGIVPGVAELADIVFFVRAVTLMHHFASVLRCDLWILDRVGHALALGDCSKSLHPASLSERRSTTPPHPPPTPPRLLPSFAASCFAPGCRFF